ncbi:hypothetical protein ABBQ38_004701 [Trebouxia sp. C0009 RCD-2024]
MTAGFCGGGHGSQGSGQTNRDRCPNPDGALPRQISSQRRCQTHYLWSVLMRWTLLVMLSARRPWLPCMTQVFTFHQSNELVMLT